MARAEREGHKYIRRELRPNGTYKYIYEEPAVTTGNTNVNGATPTARKTGSWVESYYKTMNAVSTSSLVTADNVAKGKKRASKKVRTVKQLKERQKTKEDYDKMINDVKTEVGTKTKQNEEYETTWGTILRRFAGDPDAKVYQNTYKADVDIVAPSLEKRKQAAEAIVNANKK